MFCGNTDNLVWTLGSSNISNLIMLNWLDSYRRTGEVSDFAQPAERLRVHLMQCGTGSECSRCRIYIYN